MSLPRAVLYTQAAASRQFAVSSLKITPSSWEIVTNVDLRPHYLVRVGNYLMDIFLWLTVACEIFVASHRPASRSIVFFPCPAAEGNSLPSTYTSPMFFTGAVASVVGISLVYICHQKLGILYKSSLNLRPGHHLVTRGPYSYVRHPTYLGCFLVIAGSLMCSLSKGSWIQECGVLMGNTKWIIYAWFAWSSALLVGLLFRARKEDAVLRERFGVSWKYWSAKVPYWFIPGIL